MAAVLATAASLSPIDSDIRAELSYVDNWDKSWSSICMALTDATEAMAMNFILKLELL